MATRNTRTTKAEADKTTPVEETEATEATEADKVAEEGIDKTPLEATSEQESEALVQENPDAPVPSDVVDDEDTVIEAVAPGDDEFVIEATATGLQVDGRLLLAGKKYSVPESIYNQGEDEQMAIYGRVFYKKA